MISTMSIKNKVLLLMTIPIISILFFTGKIILADYHKLNELSSLDVAVELTTKVSMLVHETQKERGATAGYLGSKGKNFKETLAKQRLLTNKRRVELSDFIKNNDISSISLSFSAALDKALNELGKLDSIRTPISSLNISAKDAISYFTNMNAMFLSIVIEASKISTSPIITKELVAYSNFLLSKERAGIERAVASSTLAQDFFSKGMRIKFNNLIASQNSFMENFLKYASKDAKTFYEKTLVGKDVDEVAAIRKTLLGSANKQIIISSMKELVGYGGLIHNFKNYVIRGTPKYETKVRAQYKQLMSKVEEYKNLGKISKEELELLDNVTKVFTKYFNGLDKVVDAVNNNTGVKILDKVVKVSDGPAIKSLNKLGQSLFSVESKYWFDTITAKINLLKKIDDFLAKELLTSIGEAHSTASKNFYMIIVLSIVSISLVLVLSFFMVKGITKTLVGFRIGLVEFFDYINKKTNDIKLLDDSNHGEIGHMASVINENIKSVQKNVEEEKRVISKTIEVLKEFEQGDLSQRVNLSSSNVALDELTSLLDNMASNIQRNIDNVLNILKEYSSYNYMNKIDNKNLKAHLKELADGVNDLGDSITKMLVDSKKVGTQLNQSSKSLLTNVDVVNQSSTKAAASLEETSASLEEITGSIVSSSESIVKMSANASSLDKATKEGEELANKTMNAMVEINEQVSLINESISIIDQIAFQTNILSLNAAVEAATAGEAGKGFAVVAAEVRNLASRSAEAAKEIKEIVEKANDKAGDGKNISNTMISGYEHLNENIKETISLIKNVEQSSREQRTGIEQINSAINLQDRQTQEIASAASETYQIATNTSSLSSEIVDNANEKEFRGKDKI